MFPKLVMIKFEHFYSFNNQIITFYHSVYLELIVQTFLYLYLLFLHVVFATHICTFSFFVFACYTCRNNRNIKTISLEGNRSSLELSATKHTHSNYISGYSAQKQTFIGHTQNIPYSRIIYHTTIQPLVKFLYHNKQYKST